MTKTNNLKKGIQEIIDYIDKTKKAQNATEPSAHGIKILLEKLIR
mgnify:CR=1 FL=1